MTIHVDIQKLCSLPVLRQKIGWENITEETRKETLWYGKDSWPVFCINPDTPGLRRIYLPTDNNHSGIGQLDYGDGRVHFHMDGYNNEGEWRNTWKAIKMARDFVSGELTLLERLADGDEEWGWEACCPGYWPDLLFRDNCKPAEPGAKNILVDADGQAWSHPKFRRSFFNREPFEDNPDWSRYIPFSLGWVTPEKREFTKEIDEAFGKNGSAHT